MEASKNWRKPDTYLQFQNENESYIELNWTELNGAGAGAGAQMKCLPLIYFLNYIQLVWEMNGWLSFLSFSMHFICSV